MTLHRYRLVLSSRHSLALAAVIDIAVNEPSGPVARDHLGKRLRKPSRSFEVVLQDLVRSGILASRRGVAGGYVLGRPAHSITADDVLRAVSRIRHTPSLSAVDRVEIALRDTLARMTVADLVRQEWVRLVAQ